MGAPQRKLTLPEFLDWETRQPDRHEFVGGDVFSMVGARRVHGRVVMNLGRLLGNALLGSPCEVFAETMKVQVEASVFYPDLFVTCDPRDLRTEQIFVAPTVIVEVLSPSTQAYDRSLKFAHYRRLLSLCEYVLVDPDTLRVEVFRPGVEGWVLHDMSDGPTLTLASLRIDLPMADVFSGIDASGPRPDQTAGVNGPAA
jgi:Uma2 family endonuclease